MNYLYHSVPENLKGKEIVPLNQLKELNSKAYDWASGKYEGREYLLKLKIPPLDCLWNDVIHMSPVHPRELEKEMLKAGHKPMGSRKFFKINPKILEPEKTAVYLFPFNEKRRALPKDFISFNIQDLERYRKVSELTKNYYKEEFKEGRKPLVFPFVPHILYKGKLNVEDLEVIEI